MTFEIIAQDGTKLHGCKWDIENPSAVLCLVHGLGEHSGRYHHVADYLIKNQISVYAFDLRGHGLSRGKRGHTPNHDMLLDDVEDLLKVVRVEHNDIPIILFGHSFGGNIVANYLLKRNTNEIACGILSSPWLKLAITPPAMKVKLAKMMVKVFPSYSESNGLDTNFLTKDPIVNKAYEDDPLVHTRASARLFLDSFEAGEWAITYAADLKIPVLLYHGDDDHITSAEGSREFHTNAPDLTTLKIWPGVRHEPHNDLEQGEVLEFLIGWLKSR